jgi:hypothetical protein
MPKWARKATQVYFEPTCPEHDAPLLKPIGLHELRHSFSTFLDHAGVSPSRADRYMGHSNGTVQERYRHLLPSQLDEDRRTLEEYLAGATGARTGAQADVVALTPHG